MLRMFRRFRRDKKGLAAVEFALLLPVMITLFFGVVEVSQLLSARAAVTSAASVTADLVAQKDVITGTDITNVFKAGAAIIYPFPASDATFEIFSIVDNGAASGKVAWSCKLVGDPLDAGNPAKGTTGSTSVPVDASGNTTTGGAMIKAGNLDANGTEQWGGTGSVIIGKITYTYKSPTYQIVSSSSTLINLFYTRPRRVASIAKPSSCS